MQAAAPRPPLLSATSLQARSNSTPLLSTTPTLLNRSLLADSRSSSLSTDDHCLSAHPASTPPTRPTLSISPALLALQSPSTRIVEPLLFSPLPLSSGPMSDQDDATVSDHDNDTAMINHGTGASSSSSSTDAGHPSSSPSPAQSVSPRARPARVQPTRTVKPIPRSTKIKLSPRDLIIPPPTRVVSDEDEDSDSIALQVLRLHQLALAIHAPFRENVSFRFPVGRIQSNRIFYDEEGIKRRRRKSFSRVEIVCPIPLSPSRISTAALMVTLESSSGSSDLKGKRKIDPDENDITKVNTAKPKRQYLRVPSSPATRLHTDKNHLKSREIFVSVDVPCAPPIWTVDDVLKLNKVPSDVLLPTKHSNAHQKPFDITIKSFEIPPKPSNTSQKSSDIPIISLDTPPKSYNTSQKPFEILPRSLDDTEACYKNRVLWAFPNFSH